MTIIKELDDGKIISFEDDADPDFIARRVKEKNLELKK